MTRIYTPQEIAPGLHFIGTAAVLVYLVQGKKKALVDAGMTVMGPLLRGQIETIVGGLDQLDYQFLTHSHYDHISTTPLWQRHVESLTVVSHPRLAEIVTRPNAISLIQKLNATVLSDELRCQEDVVVFDGFTVDEHVKDGDIYDLGGGITVHTYFTPGHTQDSITYYLPHAKAIIPGEAAGVPDIHGKILPEFLQSYEDYMASLERLAKLEIEMICLPHSYVLTGEEASDYIPRSIEATRAFKEELTEALDAQHGNIDAAIDVLFDRLYTSAIEQPKDAFLINLKAMVNAIARARTASPDF